MTRLPASHTRPRAPQSGKRVRPPTYTVAVYLVGAIVLLQIGMLISVFWLRAMVVSVRVELPKPIRSAQNAGGAGQTHPAVPPAIKKPDIPSLPGLATSTTHTTLLSVPSISDQLEQVGTLNDEAQLLLHQNQLRNAAQVLNSAEDLDPRNPTTLKNLAQTYYLLNDSFHAKIYWQRLVDLGPGVGTVYALAKDHVLLLDSTPDANTLAQTSDLPREVYIDAVEKTPVETENGSPQYHLRTVLMRRDAKTVFDQKKLQPYVIFYQQMPDGELLPDLSQHKGSFEDTFLFWHNKLREPFNVDYLMPVPGALGPDKKPVGDYYGFIIGIYYNKILQDDRSEPSDLVKRMPLPDAIE